MKRSWISPKFLLALFIAGSLSFSSCSTFKKCDCPKFSQKKKKGL